MFIYWTGTVFVAEPKALHAAVPDASWQTPKTAEDYNNRGLDRQNNGDLEGAIADYTKTLSLKAPAIVRATITRH